MPDLVLAKKTQRDKDWPMIRRLVEAHYFTHRDSPNMDQVRFWFRELRTPSLLEEAASAWPEAASSEVSRRSLLAHAIHANPSLLEIELDTEERLERQQDREYWLPLKQELERLRHQR